MRTIIVGDIHGCFDEFRELVEKVEYSPFMDVLVLAGDLVDKGPESGACVLLARALGAFLVLGNHDEKLVRYKRHVEKSLTIKGYQNPMKLSEDLAKAFTSMTSVGWEYLRSAQDRYQPSSGWVVVHAGLMPKTRAQDQDVERTRRVRVVTKSYPHKFVSLSKYQETPVPERDDQFVFWTDLWEGPENVIYGHSARSLTEPTVTRGQNGVRTYGIDTGCVYGGRLTALIFHSTEPDPDMEPEVVQVKAKRQYADLLDLGE